MKVLKFPTGCNNAEKRFGFSSRAKELVRLEHNAMGLKFREGEITKAEWRTYLADNFEPKSIAIQDALREQKKIAGSSTIWNVDLSRDIQDDQGENE